MASSAEPVGENIWSVSELTAAVKDLLEGTRQLQDLWVRGEISNFTHHRSGHMYFTLKDKESALRCVMFRRENSRLRFEPEGGLEVLARGRIGVFARQGSYQLYVAEMEPAGRGSLQLAFEQLRDRLEAEGLFAPERKQPLPRVPRRVGLVTSPSAAALRDIIQVTRRRWPSMPLLLAPCRVQGDGAAQEIAAAIARLNREGTAEVIIVARGGGSLEDLWAFNEEVVARAVAASKIPIVTGVGHETDVTIADLAADLRAPTPSAAAELVVPVRDELASQVLTAVMRMHATVRQRLRLKRRRLQQLAERPGLRHPLRRLQDDRQHLDRLYGQLERRAQHQVRRLGHRLEVLSGRLDSLSPLAVLARGYSITQREDGSIVRRAAQVEQGSRVEILLAEGGLRCRVLERRLDGGADGPEAETEADKDVIS